MLPEDVAAMKLPLPKGWTSNVKSAFVHAVSLAHAAVTYARGFAANSRNARLRLQAENDRLKNEVYLLREQLAILLARFVRFPHGCRPRYTPVERMRILALKAARSWSLAQTAKAMLVEKQTIFNWTKRLREDGESSFLDLGAPVNRFPDYLRHLVKRLKVLCPVMGKVRIAEVLARAGLPLAATTVGRILKEKEKAPENPGEESVNAAAVDSGGEPDAESKPRLVTAKRPNHVWHIDLTVLPAVPGFWTSWLPFALPQCWPFCWWVVAVVDHYSRRVMALAAFGKQPSSMELVDVLEIACAHYGVKPRHLITDKGGQFWSQDGDTEYQLWCECENVKPRFGAVGKRGSLAVVERLIRSAKGIRRRILLPLTYIAMQTELNLVMRWYNEHRPHMSLNGRPPEEVYRSLSPKNEMPRLEPRPRYPINAPCALPQALVRGSPGARVELGVTFMEGRRHLPIVEIKEAA